MAYTAPNDLFTSEEAILSLASSIADEDRTNLGNGTINGALDVLADALAEHNVEVPPMNAGAILALAQYVSGGGGSSDFTTAHVTFIASSGSHIVRENIHICTFLEEGGNAASSPLPMAAPSGSTVEVDAILYKGNAVLLLPQDATATSGAIASLGDGMYMISGDCSLTV